MPSNSLKVLLVEDDEEEYKITYSLLSKIEGKTFDVTWVKTYEAALEQIAQHQHDVYLIDNELGQHTALNILQKSFPLCKAPLILLSGQRHSETAAAALKAGAADCLMKGNLDAPTLERSIRQAIDRTYTLERLHQPVPNSVPEKGQLTSAIASLTTGLVITDPNQFDNPVVFANPAFSRLTGYSQSEILGRNCRLLQGADTDPVVLQALQQAIAGHRAFNGVLLNYRKDGTPFWNELTISPLFDDNGRLINFVALQSDVTARRQEEMARRETEERYALAVQGANDGIWDWNLKTSEIYFSPRWKSMLGYSQTEISNTPQEWFDRVHPEEVDWVKVKVSAHLDGLTTHFENEHRMRHRDGTYRWMLSRGLAVRDGSGRATRMAGSQTDITSRKQAEAQLLHDALHDTLTHLPNRTLLMDRLRHAIQLSKRTSSFLFAVLFLDLDRFKVINDSLGHMIGDQLLVAIAQRLSACLRPCDTIVRLGGDEFVILLEDIKAVNRVTAVADRIQQALTQPFTLEGHEVFTTASIGIALSQVGYELPEDVLRDADIAMYRAKAQGRACYEIFNTKMYVRAVALLQIETDLRRAIDRQEFELYYQPIVSLKTYRIKGFEALLRWQHSSRGMVSPAEFIPIAEETGLIIPIGGWVLREACRQMRAWQIQYPSTPLTISVNLSGKQFTPHLTEQISLLLTETCLNAQSLKLEITESVLMENTDLAAAMLKQLRDLGIQLSMDDFGTGYSSLSYLHRFPIDTLKIDRSFINKIDTDAEQLAIVRTIITLAWNLGMDVIAEGIETSRQLAQLRALQCDYGQGYFFSKPLDRAGVTQLMATEPKWQGLNAISP